LHFRIDAWAVELAETAQAESTNEGTDMATIADERRPSWCWIDNSVIDVFGPVVGPNAIAVYLVLARHANNDTRKAWPSFATIAKMAGMSRPTAIKAVGRLVEAGLIAVEKRSSGYGDWDSNAYVLLAVEAENGALLGSKADLPPSKEQPEMEGGGKPALPGVVNDVNQGGKPRLLELDLTNYTQSELDSDNTLTAHAVSAPTEQPAPEPPSKPKAQKPDTTPLLFDPVLDIILVEVLAAHYESLGRRPPAKFQNIAQRDGYRMAARVLGPEKTRKAITQCIVGNRYAMGQIVTSLLRWVDNEKRGGVARQNGQQPNEPRGFAAIRDYLTGRGAIPDGNRG